MKLLLDTHVLVWALTAPTALSKPAARAIENPDHTLLVSSASVYELFLKTRKLRLQSMRPLLARFEHHLARLGCEELPIAHRHAEMAASFDSDHADPFDRLLAAQAIIEQVAIVTKDPEIARLGAHTLW